MKTRICLAGATGDVGRRLVKAILQTDDLQLAAAVARTAAGKKLGDAIDESGIDLVVRASVGEALETQADVFVDYTTPEAVKDHVRAAIDKGLHVVIGTSGLADADYDEIDQWAQRAQVGVLAAGNCSILGALMQRFAMIAAKYVSTWEILDCAADTKPDAPSGTARELAHLLGQVNEPRWAVPVDAIHGPRESRGATLNGCQVHSLRVPGFYAVAEVVFGSSGDRLALRYESVGAEPYVEGTLLAVRKVSSFVGLKRGLVNVLDG